MKKKQAIAFLLSTAMTTGTVLPVFGASSDISGHWAEATITKWQNDGKIGGYEDITRAEFVRLLNTATTTAFTSSANISFSDVSQSDWFFADVAKAVGSGVTSGFEDGTFRPSETVTRAQAAVFICKAKGIALDETRANLFADAAEIPAWAKGAVGGAVNAGYLSGYPDGTFGANKGMTRAEAVSTLDRLSGTANQPADPNQGVSTPSERDDQKKEETTTTANAGDMVWTSGGSGGSRRGSSSSGGNSSSSSSNTISKNITINDQSDANDYKGKTITGKATIYAKDGLELKDIRFKGDVDIIANSSAVAAAYTDGDVAVAANYLADIKIYFEGRTNVSGTITVIKEGVPVGTQVVITTRTPRAISAIVKAFIPTRIVGFEVPKVEASAPVEVAPNAKVGTITADDGASVVAEGEVDNVNVVGKVDNIELSGTGSTDVKVNNGASVEKIDVNGSVNADVRVNGNAEVKNVAISDKASADVAVNDTAKVGNVAVSDNAEAKVDVKDTAKVEKVDIADSAVAKVDVAPEAKVDAVTSTSTAPGSAVTGSGEVGKIEAPAGTMDKDETITTPIVTPPATEDNKKPETGNVAVTGISLSKTELSLEEGKSETLTATVKPDDATDKTVTWESSDSEKVTVENGKVTAVAEGTATITATTKDGGKTAECAVTVTAVKEPETPVTPADPVKANFTLEKVGTDGAKVKLISADGGSYQYVLAASDQVPKDAAWTDLVNSGTELTVGDMTHVHIRAVNGTGANAVYSDGTIAIALDTAVAAVPVESITLDQKTLSLEEGKTATLKATVTPAEATNKNVTWESNDETKVTVDANGKVTAKAVTEANKPVTITAKAGDKTATCTVTVTAADVSGKPADPVVTKFKLVKVKDGEYKLTSTDATGKYEYALATEAAPAEDAAGWTDVTNTGTTIKNSDDTKTHVHIRAVGGTTDAPTYSAGTIKLALADATPETPEDSSVPSVTDVTAEKENAAATSVKVTGLTVPAGKTVQYYAAATAVTDWESVQDSAWKAIGTATDDTYTLEVAATDKVIYFRYAGTAADGDTPAVDPSAASAKVDITVAAPKLSATVTSSAAEINLDKPAGSEDTVTITVSDPNALTTTGATARLSFTAGEGDNATSFSIAVTSDAVKFDSTTKTTTITFKPTKKTESVVGCEPGKTYTLVSGSVSGADGAKLFDIVPATATAEKGITFTTKADTAAITATVTTATGITAATEGQEVTLTLAGEELPATDALAGAKWDIKFKAPKADGATEEPTATKLTTGDVTYTKTNDGATVKFTTTATTFETSGDYTFVELTGTKIASAGGTDTTVTAKASTASDAKTTVTVSANPNVITTTATVNTTSTTPDLKVDSTGSIVLDLGADLTDAKDSSADMKATVVFEATTATGADGSTKVTKTFENCVVTPQDGTSKKGKITITLDENNKFDAADTYTLKSVEITTGVANNKTVTVTPAKGATLTIAPAALSAKASIVDANKAYDVSTDTNKDIVITLAKADSANAVPTIDTNATYAVTLTATENKTVTLNSSDKDLTFKYATSGNTITISGAAGKFDAGQTSADYTLKSVVITNANSIITATIDSSANTLTVTTAAAAPGNPESPSSDEGIESQSGELEIVEDESPAEEETVVPEEKPETDPTVENPTEEEPEVDPTEESETKEATTEDTEA